MEAAPIRNSSRNPRAIFANRKDAFEAATAINDRFSGYYASYRKIEDRLWEVEAKGINLPDFIKALSAAGCVGLIPSKKEQAR